MFIAQGARSFAYKNLLPVARPCGVLCADKLRGFRKGREPSDPVELAVFDAADKNKDSVEWSMLIDKGVIFVGVIKGILSDLDYAISRY